MRKMYHSSRDVDDLRVLCSMSNECTGDEIHSFDVDVQVSVPFVDGLLSKWSDTGEVACIWDEDVDLPKGLANLG